MDYDPGRVSLIFRNVEITGFAPGTYVSVTRNTDEYSVRSGAKGAFTRVRSRDETGRITFRLLSHSPTNTALSQILRQDKLIMGSGKGPVQLKELGTAMIASADEAWIVRTPDVERATEDSDVEWIIESGSLDVFPGGEL